MERQAWQDLTGQTPDESRDNGWLKVLHPDDVERVNAAWNTAREHHTHFNTDYRVRCLDGVYRWFNVRGVPIFNEDGSIRQWVGLCLAIAGQARRGQKPVAVHSGSARGATLPGAIVRAARALLDWNAADLVEHSGISLSSIRRIEADDASPMARRSTQDQLIEVFERAGVQFLQTDGVIDGARLAQPALSQPTRKAVGA